MSHSRHRTVVDYGVREMMKHKSPSAAAKSTAKKLNGGVPNIFIDPSAPTSIDEAELEDALWERMADYVIECLGHIRAGMEHFALDGAMDNFGQSKGMKPNRKVRAELKARVIDKIGNDPFTNDKE